MIESKFQKPSFDSLGYSFKKEKEKKVEEVKENNREKKKKENTGTDINEYGYTLLSKIQLFFIYLSLVLIPISLFPLEWVMFEYGRVFVLLIFTILLLTLELIKFFLKGKVEVYKSPYDIILVALGFSFLLSFLFSTDSLVSFWGYEFRFGTGFISIITILTYVVILKSVIKNFRRFFYLILSLNIGIFLSALLSIFSFYGINPFGFIPVFEKFFFVGLPLFNSAKLSITIWSLSIPLSLFVFYHYFKIFSNDEGYLNKKLSLSLAYRKKRMIQLLLFFLFALFVSTLVFAISIFCIKNLLWFGIVSLVSIIFIFLVLTFLCTSKFLKFTSALVIILIVLFFGISRLFVGSVESENIVEQIALDNTIAWDITVSSLSESVPRSLFGLGNDNFVVAYNLYRPAFSGEIDLNFVNYSYSSSEILNIVVNRGLVGLFIWLLVGVVIIREFLRYLTDETRKKILNSTSIENIGIVLLNLVMIYIWIFAFFTYYGFFLYFVFFLILIFSSLLKNLGYKMYSESIVIQTNFFVEKIGLVKNDSLPKFLILLVCISSVLTLYYISNDFLSRVYAVKAEVAMYNINENEELMFQEAIENYDSAIALNPNNYVFRRKVSLVLMDYMNKVLSKEYAGLTEDGQRQEFIRIVGVYAEAITEEARQATDLAPTIAVNWSSRDLVYSELVRMGFHNYVNTAMQVSEQSILRNPNNYNSHGNKATYLYFAGDNVNAMTAARKALEINPYYIPGLVLAGELSMGLQDVPNAKVYFEKAKVLIEELGLDEGELRHLYEQVEKNLEYIWSLSVNLEVEKEVEVEEIIEDEIEEENILKVSIENSSTWVEIVVDDQVIISQILQAGYEEEFEVEENFRINTGIYQNTKIGFNQQEKEFPQGSLSMTCEILQEELECR